MLTSDLAKIKKKLGNFREISDEALVPFVARRLKSATVKWINHRWLIDCGIDAVDAFFCHSFSRWLVENYGYIVPMAGDDESFFCRDEKIFYADRYGETGGAPHGGSGRVGSDDLFQVKGIGRTPLVGEDADWLHSNGCASLEEAIREAVYSEVFYKECPHGAIPVIAILDTQLSVVAGSREIGERRALILRPNVVRVSHLQRATHFRPRINVRRSQLADAARTSDFVKWYLKKCSDPVKADETQIPSFLALNARVASQIAFCEIFRIFHGGFYSSNISIKGEIFDFGGARSLPDWRRAEFVHRQPRFGEDLGLWINVAKSVLYYLEKYGQPVPRGDWLANLTSDYTEEFGNLCLAIWGIEFTKEEKSLADRVIFFTRKLFFKQQREMVSYIESDPYGLPWIYDDIISILNGNKASNLFGEEINELTNVFYEMHGRYSDVAERVSRMFLIAARYFKPRPILYREVLQPYIKRCLDSDDNRSDTAGFSVNSLVALTQTLGRRNWPGVKGKVVSHQYSDGISECLLIDDAFNSPHKYVHLFCKTLNDMVLIFGRWYPMKIMRDHTLRLEGNVWEGIFEKFVLDDGVISIDTGYSNIKVGPFFEAI